MTSDYKIKFVNATGIFTKTFYKFVALECTKFAKKWKIHIPSKIIQPVIKDFNMKFSCIPWLSNNSKKSF